MKAANDGIPLDITSAILLSTSGALTQLRFFWTPCEHVRSERANIRMNVQEEVCVAREHPSRVCILACGVHSRHELVMSGVRVCRPAGDEFMSDDISVHMQRWWVLAKPCFPWLQEQPQPLLPRQPSQPWVPTSRLARLTPRLSVAPLSLHCWLRRKAAASEINVRELEF